MNHGCGSFEGIRQGGGRENVTDCLFHADRIECRDIGALADEGAHDLAAPGKGVGNRASQETRCAGDHDHGARSFAYEPT
jgi:hypothetical protein